MYLEQAHLSILNDANINECKNDTIVVDVVSLKTLQKSADYGHFQGNIKKRKKMSFNISLVVTV